METNASDFALRAILSQMEEEKKLHLVAFYSKKKFNYRNQLQDSLQ